ncbi:ABC transporter permease [Flagellimonas sp.]|uniref:ABC transporter permease n=1 Tax=Flagellimonas sp. TaxID=2058762 RepID=UPI003F4A7E00
MIKHYLLLFGRNIKKYKSTFAINLIGLSTGLACVILITLWVIDELRVDKFHANDSNLYQVWNVFETPEGKRVLEWTPPMLAETMVEQLPEVEYASAQTLPGWFSNTPLRVNDKIIKAPGIFAEKDYFNIFSYNLILGDKDEVLTNLNGIVISESLAIRTFGSPENSIGQTIEWEVLNYKSSATVNAVFEDVPSNSTTQFEFILPFKNWENLVLERGGAIDWVTNNPATYIVLKEGTNSAVFAEKIKTFSKQQDENVTADLVMTQYSSNYLYGNFENGKQARGRMDYVYLFSLIALFIMVIACINFMNLSTANASRRFKEIGIKKAMGSKRRALIFQYFGEAILNAFVSFGLSIFIVYLCLPYFNSITGKSVGFDIPSLAILCLIVLATGLLAGSYPALHLSHFSALQALGGNLKGSLSEVWMRKGLVIFQFAITLVLIVSVLVVYEQISYVQSKNLGMDKDNVVYFELEGNLSDNRDAFMEQIKLIPGVVNAGTTSSNIIGTEINTTGGLSWTGDEEERFSRFSEMRVGYDFIETMDMKLKKGRAFSKNVDTDTNAIVFNESAIEIMGLEDPIGRNVQYGGVSYQIVGVLEDFHFKSLREAVGPLFFRLGPPERLLTSIVRIEKGKTHETLSKLNAVYQEFNKGYVFDYSFLDSDFQAQYESEQRAVELSKYFAGLAILISCLGLFGLASFTAERRKKEIGIRKVLGQSAMQVNIMLSSEFAKLVLISIGIALPLSYILTKEWLSNFAYKIPLSIWYFIGSGILVLLVALATVTSQALKASAENPIKSLRTE